MFNKRLMSLAKGSYRYIAGCVLFRWIGLLAYIRAVAILCAMFTSLLDGTFTDSGIVMSLLGIAKWIAIRFVADKLDGRFSHLSGERIKIVLRERIYRKTLALGPSYKEHVRTSEVIQISGEGVEQLEVYFGRYLSQMAYSFLAPLTIFIVLFPRSALAASLMLACVPLIPLCIMLIARFAKKVFTKYWGVYTDLGEEFLENIQGLTTLKIYRADEARHREMNERAESFRRITMRVLVMQLGSITVMDLIAYGGAAIGSIVAVMQFRAAAVDLFGCLLILLLSVEYFLPMRLLGSYFHIAMNGIAAADKIFALLDLPEEEYGGRGIDPKEAEIRVEGLSFSYAETEAGARDESEAADAGGDEKAAALHLKKEGEEGEEGEEAASRADRPASRGYALRGISFSIPARGFVALVGESGSGKSTLAALLAGVKRSYEGHILVGEAELAGIAAEDITRRITLVSAGSHIFKGTVRENLLQAKRGASDEELAVALDAVRLGEEFAERGGLDMPVSENAANLSGGQKQRLAIARALLHDSPIYVFDEATSNIDAESEEYIVGAAHELARSRSVLMISHRLGNVVGADRIHVLREGLLVESGTHGELLEKGGAYAAMYLKQAELENYDPSSGQEVCHA